MPSPIPTPSKPTLPAKSVTLPAMPSAAPKPKLDLDAAMDAAHKKLASLQSEVEKTRLEIDRLIQLKHTASRLLP